MVDAPSAATGSNGGRPHRLRRAVASVTGVAVIAVLVTAGLWGRNAPSTTTGDRATATTGAGSTGPTRPATVLWSASGQGSGRGTEFIVPGGTGEWEVAWTFDCIAGGAVGDFATTVEGVGSAAGTRDVGAYRLGAAGSGEDRYHDTGTFRIVVDTPCRWTARAVVP